MTKPADVIIANQTSTNARTDINNVNVSLVSNFTRSWNGTAVETETTEPTQMYSNMWWYDTDNNLLKIRADGNDAWISVAYLDQTSDKFRILDDTQVVNTSGTQTGLLGDQATATWETGTGTTESLVSPAKIKSAVEEHSVTSFSASEQGDMTFPSGIKFVWGYFTSTSDGDQTFNFHSAFPNNCWNISMGGVRSRPGSFAGNQYAAVEIVSKTQFRANRIDDLDGTYEFYYFAIGN